MKEALVFGAGKIGQGFIGDLLHDDGYKIYFADVNEETVADINRKNCYSLFLTNHNYREKIIDNVSAFSLRTDREKIIALITKVDILTTSVMKTNLIKVAPIIAEGLKERLEKKQKRIIVMACENAIFGTDILKKHILETKLISSEELQRVGMFPNTGVDRFVFGGIYNGKSGVAVSDAHELAIERQKLDDPLSTPITGAEYVDNLEAVLKRKIYLVNCWLAISSYIGAYKGYTMVNQTLLDKDIQKVAINAVRESANALCAKFDFSDKDMDDYIDKMIIARYDDYNQEGIVDTISRVGRQPIRKLLPDDRIIGPANLAAEFNLPYDYLMMGAAYGYKYENKEDEEAVRLQKLISDMGIEETIVKISNLKKGGPMYNTLLKYYHEL